MPVAAVTDHEPIEGESRRLEEERPAHAVVEHREHATVSFNPLDAQPVQFKQQLASRQENYDALAMHLRTVLIPGKDFDRIHIANKAKCPRPWECSPDAQPGHWSDYQLLASGADKILGILSLAPSYPGEQDFIRAALKGMEIRDVIMKCNILGRQDQTIAEGMGACGRDEVNGSLNNCIKRACKRARVDAVHRLPAVSALFESDFLAQVAADAGKQKGNSTSSRAHTVSPKFDTGAILTVMPLGKTLKGKAFADMDDATLGWILDNFQDKPDIRNAAIRVCEARHAPKHPAENPGSEHGKTPPPRPRDRGPDPAQQTTADWFSDYETYEREQRGR